jgi:hypothetical protein
MGMQNARARRVMGEEVGPQNEGRTIIDMDLRIILKFILDK